MKPAAGRLVNAFRCFEANVNTSL